MPPILCRSELSTIGEKITSLGGAQCNTQADKCNANVAGSSPALSVSSNRCPPGKGLRCEGDHKAVSCLGVFGCILQHNPHKPSLCCH